MRPRQRQIIDEFGVRPEIDPAQEIESRVATLADYLTASGAAGYVLGISGGVDSTLAGRLAQLAVERVRAAGGQATFVAVRLPYQVQHDEADAAAAVDFVGADDVVTYNVAPAVDGFDAEYRRATGSDLTDFTKGNTKARVRMVAQYALAGDRHLLVLGTDHGAEGVTGFYTKFGDGAADVLPLTGLTKRQVRALLQELGSPRFLWEKVPTADLLDQNVARTDEDELGLAYDDIDDYLQGRPVPDAVAERIEDLWWRSRHKRTTPVGMADSWWHQEPTAQAAPDARTDDAGGTALLVIDMQNSYFEAEELAAQRASVVARVNELVACARDVGLPVVQVRTEHARDRSTWTLNMLADDQGFAFPGTFQARFLDELDTADSVEVVKTRDDAFHGTDLRAVLGRLGVDHLLICGVSTHSCVAQTATTAFAYNLRAAVARDAVASEDPDLSEALLTFLHEEMRQPLLHQDDSLEVLRGRWPDA